jgi:four helix bundle protein
MYINHIHQPKKQTIFNNQYSITCTLVSVMTQRVYDLEDRFIGFSCRVVDVVEALPNSRAGNYIAAQLIRCGMAPSLLYGEAQGAESRGDFIHKMKLVLKELKETRVCLKLIIKKQLIKPANRLIGLLSEGEELIGITAKSIETARKNSNTSGK